jgi:transcription initiation factor IIE alpha subunit|tara:strand:+ start:15369 stop:15569 length:201 start_codon:yes stop_codon:yes gene_type:complete
MINLDQSIPCPVCKTKIPFDTKQLLLGVQFVCPNCQAAIGLAEESKPLVEETMKKFEEIKGKFSKG